MNPGDVTLLLSAGFVLGTVFGLWARGAGEDANTDEHVARLESVIRAHAVPPADPEGARLRRLAYDTLYDERHPEEWA